MNKEAIHAALHAELHVQLEQLRASALAAREGATHEEAKPENEYDTRALEQSYLAGAQTARVEHLAMAIASLEGMILPQLSENDRVAVGACVIVDDGEMERCYYIASVGGGSKLVVDGCCWTVLTPNSPLGKKLVGCMIGDSFEHVVRGKSAEFEVSKVY